MFDYIAIGYILISCLSAFWRGFLSSFLSLNKWLAIIACTPIIVPFVIPYVKDIVHQDSIAYYSTTLLVFIVLLIITSIIVNFITGAFKAWHKNSIDCSVGALFGLVKSWVFLLLFFFLLIATLGCMEIQSNGNHAKIDYLDDKMPKWLQSANLLPSLEITLNMGIALLPYSTVKELYDMSVNMRSTQLKNNEKNLENIATKELLQGNSASENSKINRVQNKLNNGNNSDGDLTQSAETSTAQSNVPTPNSSTTTSSSTLQTYTQAILNFIQSILNELGINKNVTQDNQNIDNSINAVKKKL